MSKFSDILKIKISKKENAFNPDLTGFDYANASTINFEQVADIRESIRAISPIINEIKLETAAIESMGSSKEYKGILDILSHGDMDNFHKRLGISSNDLFNRSDSGKRDIYISSLTEDVTNFIAQLWNAVRNAIQKVYDWSNNLTGDNTKIGICKKQTDAAIQSVSQKGTVSLTCDICDINDWKAKATEVIKLYGIIQELLTTATQSIITGQLNENALQDQLLGKMQRNNILNIKLVIADGSKSSSFVFPGIGTGRIEIKDVSQCLNECKQLYDQVLTKIASINEAIAAYAQNVTTAQNQYKCNTDCAAVVSNISSATQMITKSIVSINNYVTETLTNCLTDIASKINTSIANLPEQQQNIQPATQEQPVQQTEQQPHSNQQQEQPAQQQQQ